MKNRPQPLHATIVFGFLCGLLFIPISLALDLFIEWPQTLFLPIYVFVAVYSGILTRWSPVGIQTIIFPLLMIVMALPWIHSMTLFVILIMGVLSWIRSGLCFPLNVGKQIVAEIFLGLLAGGLLAILNPATLLDWALTVWMFFLVQALYFVFFETEGMASAPINPDPFEYAREQAENILAVQTHV